MSREVLVGQPHLLTAELSPRESSLQYLTNIQTIPDSRAIEGAKQHSHVFIWLHAVLTMFSTPASSSDSDESTASQPDPGPGFQPDEVRFLDNHLVDLHDALRYPRSRYDPRSRRYIAASQAAKMEMGEAIASDETGSTMLDDSSGALVPTSASTTFWDSIFQKSVDRFQALWVNAPRDREKSGWNYSIRDKSTWEDVYTQLQKAREFYDGDTKGLWGRYAKGYTKKRRWFVDHSGPVARQAVRFVPQMDLATPVIASVQVLVDVSSLNACQ